MYQYRKITTIVFVFSFTFYAPTSSSEENIWETLRQGGNVILMRHATADKSKNNAEVLNINDCSVQRILSPFGREESVWIGNAFRRHSVPIAKIFTSEYCRTKNTAMLAFKRATSWHPLNLLDALPGQAREARTAIVTERITAYRGPKNIIMVTHQPNITALTFEVVEPGEFLVLKPNNSDEYDVIGRLTPSELNRK